jgi:RNA polymerase sigma-70 factor (ECF subfamily)
MAEIPPTRASLLVRLRNPRDEIAWSEFIDLYAPLVYNYAHKQGLQDADASDLSQEVLAAVAGAIGRLEYDPSCGAFRNWLFTILRRRLVNWRVAQNHRAHGSGDPATQRLLEQHPAAEEQQSEWDREWQQQVFAWACEQVRKEVTVVTWQAFWRTFIDGQPGKQVAVALGRTVAAVYLARRRVLIRLKEWVRSVQEP